MPNETRKLDKTEYSRHLLEIGIPEQEVWKIIGVLTEKEIFK